MIDLFGIVSFACKDSLVLHKSDNLRVADPCILLPQAQSERLLSQYDSLTLKARVEASLEVYGTRALLRAINGYRSGRYLCSHAW